MSEIYWFIWILGGGMGDVHGPLYIFCLLIKKTEKVQDYDLYLNQIQRFDLNFFFLEWIIQFLWKGVPWLVFLYEVSIVVLIDFIAILLTPGIF